MQLRDDFHLIADGARITLHPNANNPLHKKPVKAIHSGGYFYCDGTPPEEGPDYYLRDVAAYNFGYVPAPGEPKP